MNIEPINPQDKRVVNGKAKPAPKLVRNLGTHLGTRRKRQTGRWPHTTVRVQSALDQRRNKNDVRGILG